MNIEDCYMAGFIAKPQGIKGEVKAVFQVDDLHAYQNKTSVYLRLQNRLTFFHLRQFRIKSNTEAVIAFKTILDREKAESLKGAELYFPLEELSELEGTQFYYHEIIGFEIEDSEHGKLGKVIRIDEMPAQDLVIMKYNGKEIPIPITDDFVGAADRKEKILHTSIPEGLLDL